MRSSDQTLFDSAVWPSAAHFKVQPQRSLSDGGHVNADFEEIVKLGDAAKVAFQMHPRQPDIQIVKNFSIRQACDAEKFRLGNFEEAKIRAIEDNPRGVNVAPQDAFFNREFFRFGHLSSLVNGRKNSRLKNASCGATL